MEAFHGAYAVGVLPEWVDTIDGCDPDPAWLYAGRSIKPVAS